MCIKDVVCQPVVTRMGRDVNLDQSTPVYPLRPSLFPNVPPYVKFIPVSGKNCYNWDGAL